MLELRQVESQLLYEEAASEQGGLAGDHPETGRRAAAAASAAASRTGHAPSDVSPMYSFTLSFDDLSTIGLDEQQHPRHGGPQWMVRKQHNKTD